MKNELEPKNQFPEYKRFEDTFLQWDKIVWKFDHPQTGKVEIDTYSIWNPAHHAEIADRLVSGDRCALYMMGTFGVGEFFQNGSSDFAILDNIKQRERAQNLVAFANPKDIGEFIDFDRLNSNYSDLSDPEKRIALYPGPMHAIFPVKKSAMPNEGLMKKDDNSAGFFWMPGHLGYEMLANELKRKAKGLFGGGSLNTHGEKPPFTTADLKYREMEKHPEWLSNLDFVIIDEISESFGIGRSHTQLSFMNQKPQILRIGAVSKEKIRKHSGYDIIEAEGLKFASSATPYEKESNRTSDIKVELALAKIYRFGQALEMGTFT